jgi:hypothetical protein
MTMQQPQVETLTELKLTEPVKQAIDTAYEPPSDLAFVLGYVDENNLPQLSFRGSVKTFSDTQLAVWARRAEGGLANALANNPNVVIMYRLPGEPGGRSLGVLTMKGRAHIDEDEAVRKRVYDKIPQREKDQDADYKGIPVIVDLDSVNGFIPGYRVQMKREGS